MSSKSNAENGKTGCLAQARLILRAFRHRNYQLFFFGQGTSQIGTWIQRTALSWLVYRLTGSEFLLGVVGFSSHILALPAAPFAGVLADRANRRLLLVATQTLAMVQACLLAILTLTGAVAVWHIVVLSALMGLISAFDVPIRHSFVVEMVERSEDLPNAIALNSFLVNGAKLIGPSLAGVLIAFIGEGMCFALNALSYLAVIAALLAMRVKPERRQARKSHVLHNLAEGFAYAFGSAPIRAILLMLGFTSLLGVSYTVLMPVFAKDLLKGGSRTLGLLMAAPGLGALVGALFLASRKSICGLGRVIAFATSLFGAALIAFTFSRNLALSLGLMTIAGFGIMVQMIACNTLLQTLADDDKRGRVMSFYAMAWMGMAPFGNLLIGALASQIGAPWALAIGGAGCALAAAIFALALPLLDRAVHPIYVQRGIIAVPTPVNGNEAASIVDIEEVRF